MRFFHNKIANPAGNGASWEEWLADFIQQNSEPNTTEAKVASEAKPGLGMDDAEKEPRGQMRGQVINNDNEPEAHSYQEGESVDGPAEQGGNARPDSGGTTDVKKHEQSDKGGSSEQEVKSAKCGKEMGESDDAGKVTEDHTEAGPGNDENPDPKILINNDPCYQKGESVDPAKATGKGKKQPGDPVVGKGKGKGASSNKFKKVANLSHKDKLKLFAALSSEKKNPIQYVEAMVGIKFANLTEEEKTWFTNFWKVLYPPEYVAEMVEDR